MSHVDGILENVSLVLEIGINIRGIRNKQRTRIIPNLHEKDMTQSPLTEQAFFGIDDRMDKRVGM